MSKVWVVEIIVIIIIVIIIFLKKKVLVIGMCCAALCCAALHWYRLVRGWILLMWSFLLCLQRSVSVPRGPRQSSSVWSQARRSNDNARLLRKSQQFLSAGGSTAAMTTMTTSEGDRVGYASDAFDDTGLGGGSFSRHVDNDRGSELSIRGMAGPYTIVASNFAPGTTAADISAVMEPVGGEMLGCHLVSSNPTVIAEMIFAERDGADNVVAMFNNKRVWEFS